MHGASQNLHFSGVASVTAAFRSTVTFHTLAELFPGEQRWASVQPDKSGRMHLKEQCSLASTVYVFMLGEIIYEHPYVTQITKIRQHHSNTQQIKFKTNTLLSKLQ